MPRRPRKLALLLVAIGVAACSGRREPQYLDPLLTADRIETISLMPIVDVRDDQFVDVGVVSQVRRLAERTLIDKGYGLVTEVLSKKGKMYPSSELARMNDAELAAIAPEGTRYALVIYLHDVDTDVAELGEATRVLLSGRLVDVANRRAVWHDRAAGESDLGGLLTILSGPSTESEAVYDAVRLLLSTLPTRPKAESSSAASASGRGEQTPSSPPGGMRPERGR